MDVNNSKKRYWDAVGWGRFIIKAAPYGIISLQLKPSKQYQPMLSFMPSDNDLPPIGPNDIMHQQVAEQVQQFLSGNRHEFDLPIGVLIHGVQEPILRVVATIGYGQTVTYKQIADMLGNPKALLQIPSALLENPLPLVIPCHRVVRNTENVGSHVWGQKLKLRLLQLESVNRGGL